MAAVSRTRAIAAAATMAVVGGGAAAAVAIPPPPSSHFKGNTSQLKAKYHKVKITTDRNRHVSKISVGWRAPCESEKGIFWSTETKITGGSAGLPMSGDVFHQAGSYTGTTSDGTQGEITISMKGRFTDKNHAKGTWNAKVTVKNPDGEVIDHCKVTKIKWKAARV
jgi:hypothetical protein